MIWLLFALIGQSIIAVSAVFDKVLLKRTIPSPLQYAFGIGIISFLPVVLVPFGFNIPSLEISLVAALGGFTFFWALYFGFRALKQAEATEALLAIGGFSPVFTLLFTLLLIGGHLSTGEIIAFISLVAGGLVFSWRFVGLAGIAGALFGLTNVLHKILFINTNFVTGLVSLQVAFFLTAASLLIFKNLRPKLLSGPIEKPENLGLFLLNRVLAGGGGFLFTTALFLGNPALVDATFGFRFAVIFITVLLFSIFNPKVLKEKFQGRIIFEKISATALVFGGLILLALVSR